MKKVKNPRVPRTRAGNTWTEARYWGFIRGALRGVFGRYPPKWQALALALRTVPAKGTSKRSHKEYKCGECKLWFRQGDVEVHHIQPCGTLRCEDDVGPFVSRLLCESNDLEVVCKDCHLKITKADKAEAKKHDKAN